MPELIRENSSQASIVMAIGVGGGGGNAVNHLYNYGNRDVSFMLCNTDKQALANSPIPDRFKIQLGSGLGAGNDSQKGKEYAQESVDQIKECLVENGIKMAFVVAGMGGGTGTGASPVVAKVAKDLGILTIGVVTIPFEEEGRPRIEQAIAGVDELSRNVDSLIIINNAHIVEMYGDLPMSKAYFQSNEIISKAVKSISDIINKHFIVNVDFADVCKVMRDSGVALMGTGHALGDNRAIEATEKALTSPLLHNQDIKGATKVLVCILSSQKFEFLMSDVHKVPKYIQERTNTKNETDIIWGAGYDDTLEDQIQVIVIATGFKVQNIPAMREYYAKTLGENSVNNTEEQNVALKTKKIQLDSENEDVAYDNKIQFDNNNISEHRVLLDDDQEQINATQGNSGYYGLNNNPNGNGDGTTANKIIMDGSEEEDEGQTLIDESYGDDPQPPKPSKHKSHKDSNSKTIVSRIRSFLNGMIVEPKEDEEV